MLDVKGKKLHDSKIECAKCFKNKVSLYHPFRKPEAEEDEIFLSKFMKLPMLQRNKAFFLVSRSAPCSLDHILSLHPLA